ATCATAWVSLDEQDDLPRFVACLIHALEVHDPPWRSDPDLLPEEVIRGQGGRRVVDEIVNALHGLPATHGVIALDDLHAVTDARLIGFLDLLLGHLPAHWTIAITARAVPPLTLARLRASREVAEFDRTDLG